MPGLSKRAQADAQHGRPRVYRNIATVLIAVVFVVAADQIVGWRSIVYPWLFIDRPALIVAGAGLVGLSYVLRAIRVNRYFRLRGFAPSLRLILQHTLLANLLPFRTGEFAFPVLMKRYFDMPPSRSVPGLLWLRLLDLHVLLLLVLVGVAGIALSPAAAAVGLIVWSIALQLVYLGAHRLSASLPAGDQRLVSALREALLAVPGKWSEFVESWLLTLVNWLLKICVFGWIIALFTHADYRRSLVGALGGELTSVLPIHGIAGVGTYEAGVIAAMGTFGTPLNDALTGAVNLHLFLLGVSLAGGLASLLIPRPAERGRDREGKRGWVL